MGDHSSENYLDQLLNSMHGEETEHPKEQPTAKQVLRDDLKSNCLEKKKRRKRQKRKMKKIFEGV